MSGSVMTVTSLSKSFGGLKAVNDVSFSIGHEHVVGIIGPNGSGKSTLVNLISGVLPSDSGEVMFRGQQLIGLKPHQTFKLGLCRTFQSTRLFGRLKVLQNMLVAAWSFHLTNEQAWKQLQRFNLSDVADHPAESLSYGDQKLLELGMILIGSPSLVLLDEPLAGVHESVVQRVAEIILSERSTTFVIVEHNVRFIMDISERVLVLDQGMLLADGLPEEVQRDRRVIQAYLGTSGTSLSGKNAIS